MVQDYLPCKIAWPNCGYDDESLKGVEKSESPLSILFRKRPICHSPGWLQLRSTRGDPALRTHCLIIIVLLFSLPRVHRLEVVSGHPPGNPFPYFNSILH